jgi:cephalosporin hydroxylase
MSEPTVAALVEQLARERRRREAAERMLSQLARSRAATPLVWMHRLTRRGPDLAAARAFLASPLPAIDARRLVIDEFHRLYYNSSAQTWEDTWWLGTRVLKLPLDLWLYQELLTLDRPDVVVECGTKFGGSALFLANIMDLLGHGEVLTIDIEAQPGRPEHPRITYLSGSSTAPDVVADVTARLAGRRAMVVLDSDHSEAHVHAELEAYSPLVPVDGYLIVEDTNVHGNPVRPEHPAGPGEAVRRFLAERDDFAVAAVGEKFLFTFNPGGLLHRVR